jgi:hypothetical protein
MRHSKHPVAAHELSKDELRRLVRMRKAVGSDAALLRELRRGEQQKASKQRKPAGAKKKDDHGRLLVAAVVCGEAVERGEHPKKTKTTLRRWLRRLQRKLRRHPDAWNSFGKSPEAATDRLWDRLQEPDVFTPEEWETIRQMARFRASYLPSKA